MANPLNEFGKTAQKLARNPIGIIALFIVLVYGFATLLLGYSGEKLSEQQRWAMIWFVIFFPVLVLFVFYRLVTKHHHKLYAPSDYPDPKDFLHSLSSDQKNLHLAKKVDNDPEGPSQKQQVLPPKEIIKDDYVLAEKLAFLKLEQEFQTTLQKHISLKDRTDIIFDGAATTENLLYLIEIKFTKKPEIAYHTIKALTSRFNLALGTITNGRYNTSAKLLLVVIADLNEDDMYKLENYLHDVVDKYRVEFRIFDFNKLKIEFKDK